MATTIFTPKVNDLVLADVPGQGFVQGTVSKIDPSKAKPYCIAYTFTGKGFDEKPITGPAVCWLPKNKLQRRNIALAG